MSQGRTGQESSAPTLVALVVTHNRLGQLRQTLARLLDEPADAVIVVDNASTDGTADYLSSLADPRLRVIHAPDNLGGAGGFELGLATITRELDPDWCVLMDDDARPLPGALARFRTEARALGAFDAIAAGVFFPDGQICEMNSHSRNPFWHPAAFLRTFSGGGRKGFHVTDQDYRGQSLQPLDACSFVGFFLSRRAVARVGLPDGRLFIYGDDVIYTLSLRKAGGTIGFAPWIRFEHDCATLSRDSELVPRPVWKAYYICRNGMMAYRAAAGPILIWPALALIIAKWLLRARHYSGPERAIYLRLLRLALWDGLLGRLSRRHAEVMANSAATGSDAA